jgi:hypothetical protein
MRALLQKTSVIAQPALQRPRTVKKVPFVELFGGRLQGVVSSGSDENRVYVSFLEAGSGNFFCSTNNNRPCGGLGGSPCKHIALMAEEAVLQFGAPRVAQFLKLTGDPGSYEKCADILKGLKGGPQKEQAGAVFSRFLNYLRFCELKCEPGPMPEMSWFV